MTSYTKCCPRSQEDLGWRHGPQRDAEWGGRVLRMPSLSQDIASGAVPRFPTMTNYNWGNSCHELVKIDHDDVPVVSCVKGSTPSSDNSTTLSEPPETGSNTSPTTTNEADPPATANRPSTHPNCTEPDRTTSKSVTILDKGKESTLFSLPEKATRSPPFELFAGVQ